MFDVRFTAIVCALLLVNLLPVPQSALADEDEYVRGMNAYKHGNITEAIEHLIRVRATSDQKSLSAQSHYLLGNCYTVMMSRSQEFARDNYQKQAEKEYRSVLAIDPNGVGKLARSALNGLEQAGSAPAGAAAIGASNPAAANPAAGSATNPAKKGVLSPIERTVADLQEQGDREKTQRLQKWENMAADTERTGEKVASQLEQEKQARLTYMRNAVVSLHGMTVPVYSPDDITRAGDAYDARIASARDQAKDKAAQQRKMGQSVADDVDNITKEMMKELQTGESPFAAPKLLPGSNLYVRNFQTRIGKGADKAPEEMYATPERMFLDPVSHPGKWITRIEPVPAKGTQGKFEVLERGANYEARLQGRLMPHIGSKTNAMPQ